MNSKLFRKVVGFALILAFVFVVAGTSPQTAQAASFTVNSTLDAVDANPGDGICATSGGVCTLRAAIQEANALAGADTINLPAGTYTLSLAGVEDDNNLTGDLDIISTGGPLTIIGAGAGTTIIDAAGIDRVFHIIGATVVIQGVTIQEGDITGSGGGIFNDVGVLTIRASNIRNNTASINGGGLYNRFGTTTIEQNTVIGGVGTPNIAEAGGGVFSEYSSSQGTNIVNITNSTISANIANSGNGGGIHAADDGNLTISGSTISGNTAISGTGGGVFITNATISATNTLSISNSNILNNTASVGSGVAIQNINSSSITNTTFTNNDSSGANGGAGIYNATTVAGTTTLTLTDVVITGSDANGGGVGAGIRNNVTNASGVGRIIINGGSINQNIAAGNGGGIHNSVNGNILINLASINDNSTNGTAGGGIFNQGTLTLNDSTINSNEALGAGATGGGIYNSGTGATLSINNSTISRNDAASGGGGVYSSLANTSSITNSTISGNSSNVDGGGLYNTETTTILNSVTIAFNGANTGNGGGIYNHSPATSVVNFTNTLLSDNTAAGSGPNCINFGTGSLVSGNYNLIGNNAGCTLTGVTTNNVVNPPGGAGLNPLANNGGPTETHRLTNLSPALNVGSCPGLTTDQRGGIFVRPDTTSGLCDIGAFELQSTTNATIGDRVWNDLDADGIQDAGELGLEAITVNLLDSSGTSIQATTATDANGNYSFSAVPGTYILEFVLAAGFDFSPQNQGADDTVDSDADTNTGRTIPFIVGAGDTVVIWDAGMYQAASIGDFAWIDTNGNGIQDGGETAGVAGVIVQLYNTSNVLLASVATDANGIYSIPDVMPGTYYLQVTAPTGFELSLQDQGADDNVDSDPDQGTGQTATFTIAAGETQNQWDIGLAQLAGVDGLVWDDLNGNGVQDVGEPGLAGITINLLNSAGNPLVPPQSDTSDANGEYGFTIAPGTYLVEFILPGGRAFSAKDQGGDDTVDSDVNIATGRTDPLVLTSGLVLNNVDAGTYLPVVIGNFVWNDLNANGIQDGGETGLLGATVTLLDSAGNPLSPAQSVVTPASGAYQFTVAPGSYIIDVDPPANTPPYAFSARDQGADDTIDSDVSQVDGRTAVLTFAPGTTNNTVDIGLHLSADITGFVWNDLDGDGFQDGGAESGQDGVTVNLYDSTGSVLLATTTTSGGGNYSFNDIPAGPTVLEVVAPTGFGFSPQDAFGGNDNDDSDVNQFTGRLNLNLTPAGSGDFDAGLFAAITLGDRVWNDTNANGIQDAGELGYAGIVVNLLNSAGNPLTPTPASTTTDANGNYSFSVPSGIGYIIEVVLPANSIFSPQNQGADDAVDSDVNPATGRTVVITATADDLTNDAGIFSNASISGFVWTDTSTEGIQNIGELGLAGVTVNLYNATTSVLVTSTTTSAGPTPALGEYEFNNLVAGNYFIEIVPPTGFGFSPQDQGVDDTVDSDVNQFTGRSATITLAPSDAIVVDAGLIPASVIGNFVWSDTNEDGIQDGGEPGLGNVTVRLYNAAGTTQLASTLTDAGGNYSFVAPNGSYIIEVVTPIGYLISPQNQGADDTIDSDVDTTTGRTVVITVSADDLTQDIGLRPTATIGDFVWNDVNVNGLQDGGELGIAGVTVNLLDGAGNPLVPPQSTTTDANGQYSFPNLLPGNYIVEFVTPTGYSSTQQDVGADDTIDSDAQEFLSTAVRTGVIVVGVGTPVVNVDAGFFQSSSIGNFVWNDSSGDGLQDVGELGIDGVNLSLTWAGVDGDISTGADNLVFTTVTAGGGLYSFANIPAGVYQLQATAPVGYEFTLANVGADDTIDSDADATGLVSAITLVAGTPLDDIDIGLYQPATVTGFVWDDVDLDGIQDAGELGLAAIDVDLMDATGTTVLDTETTDGGGNYTFANASPGQHRVRFNTPAGYVISPMDAVANDAIDSDADPVTGLTAVFTLAAQGTIDLDAGMILPGVIRGRAWIDVNNDGIQGNPVSEPGWNGVTVNLYQASTPTVVYQTTVTSTIATVAGSYQFQVPAGNYILEFVLATDFTFTLQDVGADDTIDSDVDPNVGPTLGRVVLPPVSTGSVLQNWDAGLIAPNNQALVITKNYVNLSAAPLEPGDSIGWIVCVFNPNATAASNVVITDTINTATQTLVAGSIEYGIGTACPTVTPVAGDYTTGPTAVTDTNTISVTIPSLPLAQYAILYFEVTLNDPGISSVPAITPDNGPHAGVMSMSMLFMGLGGLALSTRRRWLAILIVLGVLVIALGPINGLYALDTPENSPNSLQESGGRWIRYEASAPGIEFTGYWQSINNALASGGQYHLSDDANAAISLRFNGTKIKIHYVNLWDSAVANVSVDGALLTTINSYSTSGEPSIVTSAEFTLGAGSHSLHIQSTGKSANANAQIPVLAIDAIDVWLPDSGDNQAPSDGSVITGIVWYDANHDNKLDPNDWLLEGVTVFLYKDNGANDILLDSQITNEDGRYTFSNLEPANYWVIVHRETLPDGIDRRSVSWSPVDITAPFDGDVIIPSPPGSQVYSFVKGQAWLDINNDKQVSEGDKTLAGVSVTLYSDDGDRVFDPSENGDFPVGNTVSNADGNYSFADLLPGIYWVVVDTDKLPAAADPKQTWNLLWVRVPKVSTVDLLLVAAPETHTLSGTAWVDRDRSHSISAEDETLAGLSVTLYKDNGNNYFEYGGGDVVVGTAVSSGDGRYNFEGLAAGVYWIMPDMDALPAAALSPQIWPPFWVRVPSIDSAEILLIAAPQNPDIDYPTGPGVLFGTVFNDDNGNRDWDSERESGIEGVEVALLYDNGDGEFGGDYEVAITQTDAKGRYQFDGLGSGTFWVKINESSLPENYMDTVAYGKHGQQNPQKQSVDVGNNTAVTVQGPEFAYALDTDGDGSPDGREGSGDRDNDNVANYLDPFDPTGIVFGVDDKGNTVPLENVEIRLVYEKDGEWVSADTIQPNPQQTGYKGQYRFDLNITEADEDGIPSSGTRLFRLEVSSLPADHIFPSPDYAPTGVYSGDKGGQVAPFSDIPKIDIGESGGLESEALNYHLEFSLQRGDADVVNNHIPISRPEIAISPVAPNTACVNWTGNTGAAPCATAQAVIQSAVDFTLTAVAPQNSVGEPGETIIYEHTLTNASAPDSTQSDRYRISFPAGTQAWVQQLRVIGTDGVTILATLTPGQTFDTPAVAQGASLTLRHSITITAGVANGTVDTTTIRVASLEAIAAGASLERTSSNTTTVQGACIVGTVYNDANGSGTFTVGEGLANVRLYFLQGSSIVTDELTDANGQYTVSLGSGTYSVQLDQGTLPVGTVMFIAPATPQIDNVVINTTDTNCYDASFRLNIFAPAITKFASVGQANPGDTIVYTINVTNPVSSGPIGNVIITDVLPPFVTFVRADGTGPNGAALTTSVSPPPQQVFTATLGSGVFFQPNQTFTISITVVVNQDATASSFLNNIANMSYITPTGIPGSQSSAPAIVQILGAPTTGSGGSGSGGSGSGSDGDFGTGGADDPVVGFGQEGDTGPDTLPTTGYMPVEVTGNAAPIASTQTVKLSTEGRIFIAILALLALIVGGTLLYYHNNSEGFYAWLQQKPRWLERLLNLSVILLLLVGGLGMVYTINDLLGVVDVDHLIGIDNKNLPDGDDKPIALDEENGISDSDIGIIGDENSTPLPTVPLPRPDGDTRRVMIPSLNLLTKLVEAPIKGNTWDVSNFFDELAHLEGTAVPGTSGNTVIAGHVTTTRGLGPLRNLEKILPGEAVIVKDYDVEYTYVVREVLEVLPSDIDVTYNTKNAMLTLISCADWDVNRRTYAKRIVVKAELYQWRILSGDTSDVYMQELGELARHEIGEAEAPELVGDWEEVLSYNASESSYYYSGDKGAEMALEFVGDKFRLHYVMYQNFGIFEVYLDDKLIMTVDGYSPYSGFITTEVFQIEQGRHTLRIVNTGKANEQSKGNIIGLDAIDVWRH